MPQEDAASKTNEDGTDERASPLLRSILGGAAPRAIRLAAARGALPIPRPDLFGLLVSLATDGDEEIRTEAQACLRSWSESELTALASNAGANPLALAYILARQETGSDLLATVLSNPALPVTAVASAARTFTSERLDTLLLNQTILIENPELMDEVDANVAATPLHRARLEELRRHFLHQPAQPEPVATKFAPSPREPGSPPPSIGSPVKSAAAVRKTESAAAPGAIQADPAVSPGGDAVPEEAEIAPREGTLQRIYKLNVGEKINLASKGTREERTILIRDSNRSVQDAVLNSPKLTENEVESIAKMRNVNEDILRQIAGHRDWLKSYSVLQGLATNPKTPLGIAMNLVSRLTTHDLKILQTDKNVAEAIRRMARKQVESRVNKPGSTGRSGH